MAYMLFMYKQNLNWNGWFLFLWNPSSQYDRYIWQLFLKDSKMPIWAAREIGVIIFNQQYVSAEWVLRTFIKAGGGGMKWLEPWGSQLPSGSSHIFYISLVVYVVGLSPGFPRINFKTGGGLYLTGVHFHQNAIWGDHTWDIMNNLVSQASFGLLKVVDICWCASKWFHFRLPELSHPWIHTEAMRWGWTRAH